MPTFPNELRLDLHHPPKLHHSGRPHWQAKQIRKAAFAYRNTGLSFIPIECDGSKRPRTAFLPRIGDGIGLPRAKWKILQGRYPDDGEVSGWFRPRRDIDLPGLAIICGEISGNLEVIDFDNVAVFLDWQELVLRQDARILSKLVWVRSPRPGVHGYYRSPNSAASQKLASKVTSDATTGKNIRTTLIETKGNGGYVIAPPSPAACHPSGRTYVFLTERDFSDLQLILTSEREKLLDIARSLDRSPARKSLSNLRPSMKAEAAYGERPGDVFNRLANWADILEPHGWELEREDLQGAKHWRRPGKYWGTSATTGFEGRDLLYVFSANAQPFEPSTSYSKFHAYTLLEHGGDFINAAKNIRALYGLAVAPQYRPKSIEDMYR